MTYVSDMYTHIELVFDQAKSGRLRPDSQKDAMTGAMEGWTRRPAATGGPGGGVGATEAEVGQSLTFAMVTTMCRSHLRLYAHGLVLFRARPWK